MATQLARNGDTATVPVTPERTINPNPINFNKDYRVKFEGNNEVRLTKINTALGTPEDIRIAFSEIPDIFKGSSVQPSVDTGTVYNKGGVSVLVQLTGAVYDDADPILRNYPYSAHLVLKLPVGCSTDSEGILSILQVLCGTLFDTGETTMSSRIESIIRGAITPVDL